MKERALKTKYQENASLLLIIQFVQRSECFASKYLILQSFTLLLLEERRLACSPDSLDLDAN